MTLQECYAAMEADYDDVLRRLGREDRVQRILCMLLKDGNMKELRQALAAQDGPTAFRASHTLKGIVMNLSLTKLVDTVVPLTDQLRAGQINEASRSLLQELEQRYAQMENAVSRLVESIENG